VMGVRSFCQGDPGESEAAKTAATPTASRHTSKVRDIKPLLRSLA
jgi:hypothetical protein